MVARFATGIGTGQKEQQSASPPTVCTNLAVVLLVQFFYLETANLALEEMDYLFTIPDKEHCQAIERIAQGEQTWQSFVQTSAGHRASSTRGGTATSSMDKTDNVASAVEQYEKV
jgi:hypothetical protein